MKTKIFLSLISLLSVLSLNAQTMLKDISPYTGSHPMNFTRAGQYVYFIANDNSNGENFELWKTDGTESGTVMVKDINPSGSSVGLSSGFPLVYLPVASPLYAIGSEIYFFANDYFHGYELWKSDGSDAGTQMVIDLDSSSTSSIQDLNHLNYPPTTVVYKNKIYFTASSLTLGQRIWVSDGTADGTHPLLNADNQYVSSGSYPVIYDSILYFFTNATLNRTDGTQQGTYPVYNPATPVFFYNYTKLGNKFFMSGTADQFSGDFELWTMDETGTATLVKDINPGLGESDPHNFIPFNGKVYFWANDIVHGDELWVSDGTAGGTTLVKDLYTGIQGSSSGFGGIPAILNDKFYFSAKSGNDPLLWQSDGTTTGTIPVTDPLIVQPYGGTLEINQLNFQVVGNYLYFPGDNEATGVELWRTNGTSVEMTGEIFPGGGWDLAGEYKGYNGKFYFDGQNIYFAGNDSVHHEEPWILDPNAIGIPEVKNNSNAFTIYPNPAADFFTLNSTLKTNDLTIKLFDLFGREVKRIDHVSQSKIKVDCKKLPAGVYSVSVSDHDQKILYSGKVILE